MSRQVGFDKKLDHELGKSPDFKLPAGFSDKVIRRIEMKKLASDRRINFIVMLASFGFLFLAAICFVIFTNNEILNQMLDLGGWAVLTGVMLVFMQVLDNQFVKKKLPENN